MTKKVALVTGGVRGIGLSIAQELWEKNYQVIVNYRCSQNTPLVFDDEHIPSYAFDIGHYGQCQTMIRTIEEKHGAIDILVLNAGITRDTSLLKMTEQMWEEVIQTNLSSAFYMAKAVLPSMYEKKYGRIILLSSVNAFKGQFGQVNYCAAKAGLLGFMRALAQECIKKGITVNAIAPGYTDTDMVKAVPENILSKIIESIPAQRLASPQEIARCVSFLASEEAGYITGHTIHVNGGMYFS
jgi:acetoacetyl-CoA reductase